MKLPTNVIARWDAEDWDDERMVASKYRYEDLDSGDAVELTEVDASLYVWGQTEDNMTGGSQAGSLKASK